MVIFLPVNFIKFYENAVTSFSRINLNFVGRLPTSLDEDGAEEMVP